MKNKQKSLMRLSVYLLLASLITHEVKAHVWRETAFVAGGVVTTMILTQMYSILKRTPAYSKEIEKNVLIKALLCEFEEVTQERDKLALDTGELQSFIDELQKLCDMLSVQNKDMQGEKSDLVDMCKTLQQELETVTVEFKKEQDEKCRLAQELDSVQDNQALVEEQRKAYEGAYNDLETKIDTERKTLNSSTDRLEKMMDNLKLQLEEIYKEKTGLVRFFDDLSGKFKTWKTSYAQKTAQVKQKGNKNTALLDKFKQLRKQDTVTRGTTDRRQQAINDMHRRITNLLD
jgi:chromosome segregation ATPase